MTYSWVTKPNGQIIVDDILLYPDAGEKKMIDERVLAPWLPHAAEVSKESGVPLHWILGTIATESNGNPKAVSSAGAVGLMQLLPRYHFTQGESREQMFDPRTNIRAGAKYLASFLKKGYDLPRAAAAYNRGHIETDSASAWGLAAERCKPEFPTRDCYMDKTVRYANYVIDALAGRSAPALESAGASGSSSYLLLVGAVAAAAAALYIYRKR